MNAEIKELHLREKELSKSKVNYEEDDVFSSSNGSSVDEFEHAESPRLESGFYSNLGEEEPFNTESPDLKGSVIAAEARDLEFETPLSPVIVETRQQQQHEVVVTVNGFQDEAPESPRVFTFQ
jgi:hypothetical protein